MRPDDECPFARPFPAGFSDCPAFEPQTYIALDLQYRVLPPVWSCHHLRHSREAEGRGFYAACGLGGAAARLAYANSMESERVELMRRIRGDSVAISTPLLQELWAIKGREMNATRRGDREAALAAARKLAALRERFVGAIEGQLGTFADELDRVGIELEGLRLMSISWFDSMVRTTTTDHSWQISEELLNRFPPDVRRLLQRDPTAGQVSQSPERSS